VSTEENDSEDQGMVLLADGFHRAFMGLTSEWSGAMRSVYDYDRCVRILMRRDGMSEEDAIEYMEFNVVGSYVGKATPLFVRRMKIEEL
jgi:hypothetical protein